MFELPDDDDNFWEELPLEDITNNKSSTEDISQPAKRLRTCESGSVSPPETRCVAASNLAVPPGPSGSTGHPLNTTNLKVSGPENPAGKRRLSGDRNTEQGLQNHVLETRTPARRSSWDGCGSETDTPSRVNHPNQRRSRRKFPGPAGLLPKLAPGQSFDHPEIANVSVQDKPVKDEAVVLSSQSSQEDMFGDSPWQTLLHDLGQEGCELLKKFAINGILTKASKKQLSRGKVPLVFAVIETIDNHGTDASVSLKDKSGKMQGTVHRDLMKEYEAELQPGSAMVLRQVSVISLTSRNHYLNITPANIVCIYQNRSEGLHKLRCLESDLPLQQTVVTLGRKAIEMERHQNIQINSEPKSVHNSSVNQSPSLPNTGLRTPLQNTGLRSANGPATPRPQMIAGGINSNSTNQCTPGSSKPGWRFKSPTSGVRPVVQTPVSRNMQCETLPARTSHTGGILTPYHTVELSSLPGSRLSAPQNHNRNPNEQKVPFGVGVNASPCFTPKPCLNQTQTTGSSHFQTSTPVLSSSNKKNRNTTCASVSTCDSNPRQKSANMINSSANSRFSTALSRVSNSVKTNQGSSSCSERTSDVHASVQSAVGNDRSQNWSNTCMSAPFKAGTQGRSDISPNTSGIDSTRNHGIGGNYTTNTSTPNVSSKFNQQTSPVNESSSTPRSKWSFKSRQSGTGNSTIVTNLNNNVIKNVGIGHASNHGTTRTTLTVPKEKEEDNLWQDDLSDDLLSQLSEELM